jgi:hypothetical protein
MSRSSRRPTSKGECRHLRLPPTPPHHYALSVLPLLISHLNSHTRACACDCAPAHACAGDGAVRACVVAESPSPSVPPPSHHLAGADSQTLVCGGIPTDLCANQPRIPVSGVGWLPLWTLKGETTTGRGLEAGSDLVSWHYLRAIAICALVHSAFFDDKTFPTRARSPLAHHSHTIHSRLLQMGSSKVSTHSL